MNETISPWSSSAVPWESSQIRVYPRTTTSNLGKLTSFTSHDHSVKTWYYGRLSLQQHRCFSPLNGRKHYSCQHSEQVLKNSSMEPVKWSQGNYQRIGLDILSSCCWGFECLKSCPAESWEDRVFTDTGVDRAALEHTFCFLLLAELLCMSHSHFPRVGCLMDFGI